MPVVSDCENEDFCKYSGRMIMVFTEGQEPECTLICPECGQESGDPHYAKEKGKNYVEFPVICIECKKITGYNKGTKPKGLKNYRCMKCRALHQEN